MGVNDRVSGVRQMHTGGAGEPEAQSPFTHNGTQDDEHQNATTPRSGLFGMITSVATPIRSAGAQIWKGFGWNATPRGDGTEQTTPDLKPFKEPENGAEQRLRASAEMLPPDVEDGTWRTSSRRKARPAIAAPQNSVEGVIGDIGAAVAPVPLIGADSKAHHHMRRESSKGEYPRSVMDRDRAGAHESRHLSRHAGAANSLAAPAPASSLLGQRMSSVYGYQEAVDDGSISAGRVDTEEIAYPPAEEGRRSVDCPTPQPFRSVENARPAPARATLFETTSPGDPVTPYAYTGGGGAVTPQPQMMQTSPRTQMPPSTGLWAAAAAPADLSCENPFSQIKSLLRAGPTPSPSPLPAFGARGTLRRTLGPPALAGPAQPSPYAAVRTNAASTSFGQARRVPPRSGATQALATTAVQSSTLADHIKVPGASAHGTGAHNSFAGGPAAINPERWAPMKTSLLMRRGTTRVHIRSRQDHAPTGGRKRGRSNEPDTDLVPVPVRRRTAASQKSEAAQKILAALEEFSAGKAGRQAITTPLEDVRLPITQQPKAGLPTPLALPPIPPTLDNNSLEPQGPRQQAVAGASGAPLQPVAHDPGNIGNRQGRRVESTFCIPTEAASPAADAIRAAASIVGEVAPSSRSFTFAKPVVLAEYQRSDTAAARRDASASPAAPLFGGRSASKEPSTAFGALAGNTIDRWHGGSTTLGLGGSAKKPSTAFGSSDDVPATEQPAPTMNSWGAEFQTKSAKESATAITASLADLERGAGGVGAAATSGKNALKSVDPPAAQAPASSSELQQKEKSAPAPSAWPADFLAKAAADSAAASKAVAAEIAAKENQTSAGANAPKFTFGAPADSSAPSTAPRRLDAHKGMSAASALSFGADPVFKAPAPAEAAQPEQRAADAAPAQGDASSVFGNSKPDSSQQPLGVALGQAAAKDSLHKGSDVGARDAAGASSSLLNAANAPSVLSGGDTQEPSTNTQDDGPAQKPLTSFGSLEGQKGKTVMFGATTATVPAASSPSLFGSQPSSFALFETPATASASAAGASAPADTMAVASGAAASSGPVFGFGASTTTREQQPSASSGEGLFPSSAATATATRKLPALPPPGTSDPPNVPEEGGKRRREDEDGGSKRARPGLGGFGGAVKDDGATPASPVLNLFTPSSDASASAPASSAPDFSFGAASSSGFGIGATASAPAFGSSAPAQNGADASASGLAVSSAPMFGALSSAPGFTMPGASSGGAIGSTGGPITFGGSSAPVDAGSGMQSAPAFGASGGFGFGATSSSAAGGAASTGSAFGAPSSGPSFGGTPVTLFGAGSSSATFGAAPSSGMPFGGASSSSIFGAAAGSGPFAASNPAFNFPASSAPSFGGAPAPSSQPGFGNTPFGSASSQAAVFPIASGPSFGSGGLNNTPAPQPAAGAPFGAGAPASVPAFGAPQPGNFGAPSTGFSFGTPGQTGNTFVFGSVPQGPSTPVAFGAPPQNAAPSFAAAAPQGMTMGSVPGAAPVMAAAPGVDQNPFGTVPSGLMGMAANGNNMLAQGGAQGAGRKKIVRVKRRGPNKP